ncbi:ERAD-associated protein [Orbilia brochopaga]|uniref:ERAD-associated protein n=1 Tax=Orbilia brochopaga TaxID=3140254 RepID=A0AAV9UF03_9PEZI
MARRRPYFFYLFLFLSTLSIAAHAIEPVAEHEDVQLPLDHHARKLLKDATGKEDGARIEDDKSAKYVEDALKILSSLRQSSGQSKGRGQGRLSYLSTFLYYLQKALDFLFIANVPTQEEPVDGQSRSAPVQMSKPLQQAVHLLSKAVAVKNPDAMYLLAEMNFYGNWSHPRNSATAFGWYKELASLTGNSTAQNMVAFMYATGYGGIIQRDQAKALLYHTFAALGGNTRSEMTLAYRHHAGISTPRNCEEAAFFYKRVADKAIEYYRSGPPGGHYLPRHSHRITDELGGTYGAGASSGYTGRVAKRSNEQSTLSIMDDIIEYLMLLSNKGELPATHQLAKLYYEGPRGLQRDLKKARDLYFQLAKKMWTKDGKEVKDPSDIVIDVASKAAGYLGRMYLRGEALSQDYALARRWFARGLKYSDTISQHGMGYLYEHGLAGLDKNMEKATKLYKTAAEDDYGPAQVSIGKIFYQKGEFSIANKWFELATRHGEVEAYYYLAEINNQGNGRDKNCGMATLYFKHVAERVEALHAPLEWSHRAYKNGNKEAAIVGFMMAAEQGYESGQANVAYLLDEQKSKFPLDWWRVKRNDVLEQELALIYWTRSAKQQNIDSYVKMGDYYLAGVGTESDSEKAAACYTAASEFQQSAQALWNLGWMHENGIGVEQDYHLAKRYYDLAVETNSEAYLPVTLSLLKLRARSFWNTVTGGKINAIGSDPEPQKRVTVKEWLKRWFTDEKPQYTHNRPGEENVEEGAGAGQDAKAQQEHTQDEFYGDEMSNDEFLENMLILGIMFALMLLVVLRNQRQQQQRQREQQQQQQLRQNGQARPGAGGRPPAAGAAGAAAPPAPPAAPPGPGQAGAGGADGQAFDPRNNPWGIPPPPGF